MPTSYFSTSFVRLPLAGYAPVSNPDWAALAQSFRQPEFLEALYIASPALYEEALKLDLNRQPDEKARRVVYSLVKYLSRYATRCTPFGLFGGFATVPVANGATDVQVSDGVTPRKVIRLDMNYLCALAQDLEKHPDIKPWLQFRPNTSLYALNGQYRYVEYRYSSGGMRQHHLSSAEQSEYLDQVLERARTGATVGELAGELVSDDITEEEALGFVDQLIDLQLLVSELEPALTGGDFLVQIQTALDAVFAQNPSETLGFVRDVLDDVRAELKRVEESGADFSTEKFAALEEKLRRLPTPFDRKVLFQIDSYLPQATGQLNRGLLNKLAAKIPTLMKLSPGGDPKLDEFCSKFYEKYEDEEVPLVIALDPEIGVGYPIGQRKSDVSPLIEGILAEGAPSRSQPFNVPAEHQYLLRKIAEAQLTGEAEIVISEDELRQVEPHEPYLPLTNAAMFSVIREDGREKLVLDSFGGANGTYLLGRFGHTDPSVRHLLDEISRAEDEAAPDIIFADIVHLPEARTGNVIIRPALKAYQIPFLGKASVDAEHQIPVTDLMIRVRGKQVVLRSRSLNKIVVPRLSNAHNYSGANALDCYHFLCAIQSQQTRLSLNAVKGRGSEAFLFIPRISLDNIILAEAQWNLREEHFKPLADAFKTGSRPRLEAVLAHWRAQYRIPRYICVVDFDNELYVDLENQWLAETFVNEIKSRPQITLKEFLFRDDTAVVRSERGWHTNQFVVAFQNRPETPRSAPAPQKAVERPAAVARKFFTGSEWLYYKIYTGIKTADWLLAEVLRPLTERFQANGWIDKFFFIRYADPNGHVRFRFHFPDPQWIGPVVTELHEALAPYVENRTVTAILNDTYNRELERYGHHSIEAVEDYFHIDSETILQFLSLIEGSEGEECRWRFGMKMTDELLRLLGLDTRQRLEFAERQAAYFGKEFGYNSNLKKQLDARYREIEPAIQELFDEAVEDHQFFYDLSHQRTDRLRLLADYLQTLRDQNLLQLTVEELLASLIHMNVNRLFRDRQRFVEYSIYYHLHKYYRTVYGRTVLAARPKTPSLSH